MSSDFREAQIQIRPFGKADIEFALEQTGREGWDSTASFFETLIAHDPEGSFIAELDLRRAGMVTTTRYVESGTWKIRALAASDSKRIL